MTLCWIFSKYAGIVTNMEKVSVPFVASQMADLNEKMSEYVTHSSLGLYYTFLANSGQINCALYGGDKGRRRSNNF